MIRHPLERLWSLYKYIKDRTSDPDDKHHQSWRDMNRIKPDMDFSNWILFNESIFTMAHFPDGTFAKYTTSVPLPETKKSQWHTLRPDLSTDIFKFGNENLDLEIILDIKLEHKNGTISSPVPPISDKAIEHIRKHFKWDLTYFKDLFHG